ncbi:MAG: hypothetical protein ACFFBP_24035 [Promethearchaeota archaeon]
MSNQETQMIINNLNKVFIPHKSVLEMEALICTCLIDFGYDHIREVPSIRPNAEQLYDILKIKGIPPLMEIVERFINITVEKLKPIAMYSRNHHNINRMGNVIAYSKTRIPLFLALYRLKFKFLLLKNYLDRFKQNNYNIISQDSKIKFRTAIYEDYYLKNKMALDLMIPERHESNEVRKRLNLSGKIQREDIIDMATIEDFTSGDKESNYLMRSIKASFFVTKFLFSKIDVLKPFRTGDIQVDVEETISSNIIIPNMIQAVSNFHSENNLNLLKDSFLAFEFLIKNVLEGINNALGIASGGQIQLDLESNIKDFNVN